MHKSLAIDDTYNENQREARTAQCTLLQLSRHRRSAVTFAAGHHQRTLFSAHFCCESCTQLPLLFEVVNAIISIFLVPVARR